MADNKLMADTGSGDPNSLLSLFNQAAGTVKTGVDTYNALTGKTNKTTTAPAPVVNVTAPASSGFDFKKNWPWLAGGVGILLVIVFMLRR